ncbi:hypothetical protein T12_8321 [Trichinella patagoniensis]|uniref:Uncharacterized protein n=1 Tax=Trichinella patagoniensis TaxID=990121 RepID=A0A0V0Z927_9BILA|nr:hypothetical protein T12_8321 [Trichinella patagoniensis]
MILSHCRQSIYVTLDGVREPTLRPFVGSELEQIDSQFSHRIILPVRTFFPPLHCHLVVSVRGGQAVD